MLPAGVSKKRTRVLIQFPNLRWFPRDQVKPEKKRVEWLKNTLASVHR